MKEINVYLQWTINITRLLTVGGTPFEAMQRYALICNLFTRDMVNVGPSTLKTIKINKEKSIN